MTFSNLARLSTTRAAEAGTLAGVVCMPGTSGDAERGLPVDGRTFSPGLSQRSYYVTMRTGYLEAEAEIIRINVASLGRCPRLR